MLLIIAEIGIMPDALVNAILDRLVHHSVRIHIIGKSYKLMGYRRMQTRKN